MFGSNIVWGFEREVYSSRLASACVDSLLRTSNVSAGFKEQIQLNMKGRAVIMYRDPLRSRLSIRTTGGGPSREGLPATPESSSKALGCAQCGLAEHSVLPAGNNAAMANQQHTQVVFPTCCKSVLA